MYRTCVDRTALLVFAGAVYGFGTISADVKTVLGASESEKQLIAVSGNNEKHFKNKSSSDLAVTGNVGLWTGSALGGMVSDRMGPSRCSFAAA